MLCLALCLLPARGDECAVHTGSSCGACISEPDQICCWDALFEDCWDYGDSMQTCDSFDMGDCGTPMPPAPAPAPSPSPTPTPSPSPIPNSPAPSPTPMSGCAAYNGNCADCLTSPCCFNAITGECIDESGSCNEQSMYRPADDCPVCIESSCSDCLDMPDCCWVTDPGVCAISYECEGPGDVFVSPCPSDSPFPASPTPTPVPSPAPTEPACIDYFGQCDSCTNAGCCYNTHTSECVPGGDSMCGVAPILAPEESYNCPQECSALASKCSECLATGCCFDTTSGACLDSSESACVGSSYVEGEPSANCPSCEEVSSFECSVCLSDDCCYNPNNGECSSPDPTCYGGAMDSTYLGDCDAEPPTNCEGLDCDSCTETNGDCCFSVSLGACRAATECSVDDLYAGPCSGNPSPNPAPTPTTADCAAAPTCYECTTAGSNCCWIDGLCEESNVCDLSTDPTTAHSADACCPVYTDSCNLCLENLCCFDIANECTPGTEKSTCILECPAVNECEQYADCESCTAANCCFDPNGIQCLSQEQCDQVPVGEAADLVRSAEGCFGGPMPGSSPPPSPTVDCDSFEDCESCAENGSACCWDADTLVCDSTVSFRCNDPETFSVFTASMCEESRCVVQETCFSCVEQGCCFSPTEGCLFTVGECDPTDVQAKEDCSQHPNPSPSPPSPSPFPAPAPTPTPTPTTAPPTSTPSQGADCYLYNTCGECSAYSSLCVFDFVYSGCYELGPEEEWDGVCDSYNSCSDYSDCESCNEDVNAVGCCYDSYANECFESYGSPCEADSGKCPSSYSCEEVIDCYECSARPECCYNPDTTSCATSINGCQPGDVCTVPEETCNLFTSCSQCNSNSDCCWDSANAHCNAAAGECESVGTCETTQGPVCGSLFDTCADCVSLSHGLDCCFDDYYGCVDQFGALGMEFGFDTSCPRTCARNPCDLGRECPPAAICVYSPPSSSFCLCPEGYELVDGSCADIDECAVFGDLELCAEKCNGLFPPGSYSCECEGDRVPTLDGFGCEDLNDAAAATCGNGVLDAGEQCEDFYGSIGCYECKCEHIEGLYAFEPTSPVSFYCDEVFVSGCGNYLLEDGEECELGGYGCNEDCTCDAETFFKAATPPQYDCDDKELAVDDIGKVCGDGLVTFEIGEQCEPLLDLYCNTACVCNNGYSADGLGNCKPSSTTLTCGNGLLEPTEECDNGEFLGAAPRLSCQQCRCNRDLDYYPDGRLSCVYISPADFDNGVIFTEVCGGTGLLDECGDCQTDVDENWNSGCTIGCDGVSNSGKEYDYCGVCRKPTDPNWASETDGCSNDCEVTGEFLDECGYCLFTYDPRWNECVGCDGVAYSDTEIDECGDCKVFGADDWNDCEDRIGCDGVIDSGRIEDSCNPPQCYRPTNPKFNNCPSTAVILQPAAVIPQLHCWESKPCAGDKENICYTGYFGYENKGARRAIAAGEANSFGTAVNRGQPTTFSTGLSAQFPLSPLVLTITDGDLWIIEDYKLEVRVCTEKDANGQLLPCEFDSTRCASTFTGTASNLNIFSGGTTSSKRALPSRVNADLILTIRRYLANQLKIQLARLSLSIAVDPKPKASNTKANTVPLLVKMSITRSTSNTNQKRQSALEETLEKSTAKASTQVWSKDAAALRTALAESGIDSASDTSDSGTSQFEPLSSVVTAQQTASPPAGSAASHSTFSALTVFVCFCLFLALPWH